MSRLAFSFAETGWFASPSSKSGYGAMLLVWLSDVIKTLGGDSA